METITQLVTTFAIVAIILSCIALAFFVAVQKKLVKFSRPVGKIDYSKVVLTDATDFARFDDILTSSTPTEIGTMTMIAQNDYRYFTAGLNIHGFDVANADASQISKTIQGMIQLTTLFRDQIQVRQFAKPVDLTLQIERHLKEIQNAEETILRHIDDCELYMQQIQTSILSDPDDTATIVQLEDEYDYKCREIKYYEWLIKERTEIIDRLKADTASGQRTSNEYTYLVSYEYSEQEHISKALTKDERISEACRKLLTTLRSMEGVFASANLSVSIATAKDIIGMFRQQMQPWEAANIPLRFLDDTSFFNPIISSDSPQVIEEIARKEKEL